jgi:hypothetical protein
LDAAASPRNLLFPAELRVTQDTFVIRVLNLPATLQQEDRLQSTVGQDPVMIRMTLSVAKEVGYAERVIGN